MAARRVRTLACKPEVAKDIKQFRGRSRFAYCQGARLHLCAIKASAVRNPIQANSRSTAIARKGLLGRGGLGVGPPRARGGFTSLEPAAPGPLRRWFGVFLERPTV